jgi:hypothetical protein
MFSADSAGNHGGVCPADNQPHDGSTSLGYVAIIGDGGGVHDGSRSIHYAMLREMTIDFTPSQLPIVSGEVQCMRARAAFASNGDWTFTGYLHDYSTFTGDNYAFAFAFNFVGNGTASAYIVTGKLGSSLTSNPESVSFGVHGNDPWVAQNWRQAFPNGGFFRLHASDDLASAD